MKVISIRITRPCLIACLLALVSMGATLSDITARVCSAQTATPAASPQPTPPPLPTSQQETLRVYTEEILLPVIATDNDGRFDPSLEIEDLLVLEDGVPQTVQSIRRLPADVLLLLDTSGAQNPAMKTNATRDLALRLVSQLRAGDRIAVMQFGGRVELIQPWTTERDDASLALRTRLSSGTRTLLTQSLAEAAVQLNAAPAGNRHVVLVTDGGEISVENSVLRESVAQLLSTQATVHVLSYTFLGRKAINKAHPKYLTTVTANKRKSAKDIADEIMHPNAPETLDTILKRKLYLVIETDFSMWRKSHEYAQGLKQNEQWLAWLAEESGGAMAVPHSTAEFAKQADDVAREIDSQYLATYKPKQQVTTTTAGGLRRVEVFPRRVGLRVHSRRSYVDIK